MYLRRLEDLITGKKGAKMAYSRYQEDIKIRYGVQLRGWPSGVSFVPPSNLHTLQHVRTLRDALRSGACAWVALTAAEKKEAADAAASAPKKTRKPRSDIGVKRVVRDEDEAPTSTAKVKKSARPRKRAKTAAKAQVPPRRSRSVISSDDDEGADVEGDGDQD